MPLVRAVIPPLVLPTWSLAVLPTKELVADTVPEHPVVPEQKVAAPAFTVAPLSQTGLRTR